MNNRLIEIAVLFLRFGMISFGGPIAAMALLEEEFAVKRDWISREHFSEIYTVLKLCPGPLSTQMAIYIGKVRAGNIGGLIAGVCYILPCFLMLLIMSALYVRNGGVSESGHFLGFQIGAVVVIIMSTISMARPYRARVQSWVIALLAFGLVYEFPRYEPVVLIAFGLIGIYLAVKPEKVHALGWAGLGLGVGGVAMGTLGKLFWMCIKAGSLVFGSGLAIIPLLEVDAVREHHWLTHRQFMDGLALGQITPGPVMITATFIGFIAAAFPGAIVATIGVFLPGFVNIFYVLPKVWGRISRSPYTAHFTAFAIPAVIGAIFATTFRLGAVSLVSLPAWILFAAGIIAAVLRAPGWVVILGSGAAGYFFH